MLLFSYSPLLQLKIWEQGWGTGRWHLTYPYMSLHVCMCTYVSQSFQSAISPDQPPRHTNLLLSWSQGSKNTVPLARTGIQNKILLFADVCQCQKNSMCTCLNGSQEIFSFPAFDWLKECTVILHLFYNLVSTKLTLIAVINIRMHTYPSIPNLKKIITFG